jgi:uncharacterized protein involved in response to NO
LPLSRPFRRGVGSARPDRLAAPAAVASAIAAPADSPPARPPGVPHRWAFVVGAVLLVVLAAWWAGVLALAGGGRPPALGLAPAEAHGLAMSFGFMPSFFAGFLFTTAPKWLRRAPLPARALAPTLALQAAGWAVFLVGVHAPAPRAAALAALGLAAAACGWSLAWGRLVLLLRASRGADRAHLGLVAAAGAVGAAAMGTAAAALALGAQPLVRAAVHAGLWIFVGGTFAATAHRMVPFLGAALPALDERRPHALLHALTALFALEGTSAALAALGRLPPPAAQGALAALEAAAGAGLIALCARWHRVQGSRVRFVAMLQAAFGWLGLAFLLAGASHALAAAGGGVRSLGAVPLHAYTMGFLGTVMLAMISRVACGHAGRTVVADDVLWGLFLVLQAAGLARVGGGVLATLGAPGAAWLVLAAAVAWAGAWLAWASRIVPWLARQASARRALR